MAITILSEPEEYSLVEDGLYLKAQTDEFVINSGQFSTNFFRFSNPLVAAAGQVIVIRYGDISFTLTVSDSPDNSGYQLPSRAGYYSDEAYRDAVITYLQKNYYINRDFTIQGSFSAPSSRYQIALLSRFAGPEYAIDDGSSGHTVPGNWIVTNALGRTTKDNFKLTASVIYEKTEGVGDWQRLPIMYLIPDSENSEVTFQLQRYLRSVVNGVDWPTLSQDTPFECTAINKKYYVVLSEFYGATPLHFNATELTPKRVLKGGNLKAHRSKHEDYLVQNFGSIHWLSWFGTDRYTSIEMDNFLAFLNTSGSTETLRYTVKIWYTDGTNSGEIVLFEKDIDPGVIMNFPAGWDQLSLTSQAPTKYPVYYELYLTKYVAPVSSWSPYTKKVRFNIEQPNYLDRMVYFQNTLGGVVEVARLSGEFQSGIAISDDEFLTDLDPDTIDGFGQLTRSDVNAVYNYELSTGLQSKEQLLPYIQLLMTKHAAIVEDGQLIEIKIEPGEFEIVKKETAVGEYLYAFNFTARRTTIEKGFSA